MPHILPTRCGDPLCGAIATNRGRCAEHQPPPWRTRSRRNQEMTSTETRKWRALIIKNDSVCIDCGSTDRLEADHLIPLSEGGAKMDPSNGAPRCKACHLTKTITERETARKAKHTP